MPEQKQQNYANHTRVDPIFLFVLLVAFINVIVEVYAAARRPTYPELCSLLLSIAFLLAVLRIRVYALKVQDRVIRLEETLRMQRILPTAQHSDIARLREGQFVALRFAPDEELPTLIQQTLTNNLKGKNIKGAIKNWRADHFRV